MKCNRGVPCLWLTSIRHWIWTGLDLISEALWFKAAVRWCSKSVSKSVTVIFCFSFLSTVFICSFMVAAPIFGYLGDRFNRKVILSCGIFFWSIVTLLSSFISKEVRLWEKHTALAPLQLRCQSVGLPSPLRQGYYSVMIWICSKLRQAKCNDTLIKSDTRHAFVDILCLLSLSG